MPDERPDSWAPAYGADIDAFTTTRPWDDDFNDVLRTAYRLVEVEDRAVVTSADVLLAGLSLALPGTLEENEEVRRRVRRELLEGLDGAPRQSARTHELYATRELAAVLRFIGEWSRHVPDYARAEVAILLLWRRSESVWERLRADDEVWLQRARFLSHGSSAAPSLPSVDQLVGRTATSRLHNDPFTDVDFVVEQLAATGMPRSVGKDCAMRVHLDGRAEFFAGDAVEAARHAATINESAARSCFPLRADVVLDS